MGTKATGKGTAVAVKDEGGAVAVYGEFAGLGFENQTRDDYSLPFLGVLQGISPQLETIEGAKPGMIINTVTNDIYEAIDFVGAVTEHVVVEWKPRKEGGGLVARHAVESDVVKQAKATCEFKEQRTPEGNELAETFYVYGIARVLEKKGKGEFEPTDVTFPAVIAFASTKVKKYKAWQSKARMLFYNDPATGQKKQYPLPAHVYRFTTFADKNNDGTFHNWNVPSYAGKDAVEARLAVDSELFQEAVALNKAFHAGQTKVDYEAGGNGKGEGAKPDSEIPF